MQLQQELQIYNVRKQIQPPSPNIYGLVIFPNITIFISDMKWKISGLLLTLSYSWLLSLLFIFIFSNFTVEKIPLFFSDFSSLVLCNF